MKLDEQPVEDPRVAQLAAAEARDAESDDEQDDILLEACPLRDAQPEPDGQKHELVPLRVMAWHIDELGGGVYRPEQRPDLHIEAYATVAAALDVDIWVLLGVRRTVGRRPRSEGKSVLMDDEVVDSGAAEVARILEALRKVDPGGGWACQFPKTQSDGEIAYLGAATTCVLHRTSKGIQFSKFDLIEAPRDVGLGLSGRLACASFDAPLHRPDTLHVLASLGLPTSDPIPESLAPTTASPRSALLAISGTRDLPSQSAFNRLRANLGAIYRSPRNEGSDLHRSFWTETSLEHEALLGNFLAVSPADVLHQDAQMHWQGLEPPEHPASLGEVFGRLRDAWLVCHQPVSGKPIIDEARVVDLLRAALDPHQLRALEAEPVELHPELELPSEEGILAEYLDGPTGQEDDPRNDLARAHWWCEQLSRRWPVVAQLRFDPTSSSSSTSS